MPFGKSLSERLASISVLTKKREPLPEEKPDEVDPGDVILDKYLCDINMLIDEDGLGAKSISTESMAYLYAGKGEL